MKLVKKYSTTMFRNGRTRRECWSATSEDRVWGFRRIDDVGTPWLVIHIPTDTDCGTAASLAKAVRKAERSELNRLVGAA